MPVPRTAAAKGLCAHFPLPTHEHAPIIMEVVLDPGPLINIKVLEATTMTTTLWVCTHHQVRSFDLTHSLLICILMSKKKKMAIKPHNDIAITIANAVANVIAIANTITIQHHCRQCQRHCCCH